MMVIQDIRRLAIAVGVPQANQKDTRELICSIQNQEGHMPCFSESWSAPCLIDDCPLAEACSSNFCNTSNAHH